MILHFSHIGLTDGRTFMIPFGLGSGAPALAAAGGRRYRVEENLPCAREKRPHF